MQRATIYYSGRVQGVGFRYTVQRLALGFEVTGCVRNLEDGRVELVAEGEAVELEAFLTAIAESELAGFIKETQLTRGPSTGTFRGFQISR